MGNRQSLIVQRNSTNGRLQKIEDEIKTFPVAESSNLVHVSCPNRHFSLYREFAPPPLMPLEEALKAKKKNPDCVLKAHTNCNERITAYFEDNFLTEYLTCRNSTEELRRMKNLDDEFSKL